VEEEEEEEKKKKKKKKKKGEPELDTHVVICLATIAHVMLNEDF
jgi:hypothetical protein